MKTKKQKTFSGNFKLILTTILLCGFSNSVKAQTEKSVEDVVKSISGGKLRVETKVTPYKLIGDFNGDKIEDVAIVVELADKLENIRKIVKVENPYAAAWGKAIDPKLLGLFIIHGGGKGWKYNQKSSILLVGRNSALIFQKTRLGESGDGMQIEKDKSGKLSIVFPTEASEGILKWNGKIYTWRETEP